MTATTATQAFVTPQDLAPYVPARIPEPHPSVWAIEEVLRDGWELTTYRRVLRAGRHRGQYVTVAVEQSAAADATPHLAIVSTPGCYDESVAPLDTDAALTRAPRQLELFRVDPHGRRLRAGVLELLAERLGVDSDPELATALHISDLEPLLARSGFTPYGAVLVPVFSALESLGLSERRYGRSINLAIEGRIRR